MFYINFFLNFSIESYKNLVESELQVEKLFKNYQLQDVVDEPLKVYLLKLKGIFDKIYEDGTEIVSNGAYVK